VQCGHIRAKKSTRALRKERKTRNGFAMKKEKKERASPVMIAKQYAIVRLRIIRSMILPIFQYQTITQISTELENSCIIGREENGFAMKRIFQQSEIETTDKEIIKSRRHLILNC